MEHSISLAAMASGGCNRGKEEVIGEGVGEEWSCEGWAAPGSLLVGAGRVWEGRSQWARCQGAGPSGAAAKTQRHLRNGEEASVPGAW